MGRPSSSGLDANTFPLAITPHNAPVVDPESIDALLVDLFLEAHAQAPDEIVPDLDATGDTLYGGQEGRFYHGYYHDYCYRL